MRTDRERALLGLLDAVVTSRLDDWLADDAGRSDPAYDAGLRGLALLHSLRWDDAAGAVRGGPEPQDDDARWMQDAVLAWASSGDPGPDSSRSLEFLRAATDLGAPTGRFATYVAVEAAMAHARLDVATRIADLAGEGLWAPFGHPYDVVVAACRARLLAFRGEVAAAEAALARVGTSTDGASAAVLAGTRCLIQGNTAQASEVRRLATVVEDVAPRPVDLLGAGAQMLAAFGLIAIGDVAAAVRRLLVAGMDDDLSALNVIDRALGLELLVALAVAEKDLDDAMVWSDRARPLLGSPIADSTVARLLSRVELLAGRPDEAVSWAERAVTRARQTGRGIEVAEGEIVLSSARLALSGPGDRANAIRSLEQMVAEAESRGHRAVKVAAARQLRPIGQRLRPLSGSGWDGLTEREAEVARAVAEGASNRDVAAQLNLAEHTVRAHVSRVLAAFGVATRSALPGAMHLESAFADRPALTERQQAVAELVGQGHANAAIGDQLGISRRTVERHISDILIRWNLTSRTAIARSVVDRAPTP